MPAVKSARLKTGSLNYILMKEIVVISGKGGTGKTSYTAAFAQLQSHDSVVADCDVDAADMHLLLQPAIQHSEQFYSGEEAEINTEICTKCNKCRRVCRFNAINKNEHFEVDPVECEGCGYCARICPVNAITMKPALAGTLYRSINRFGNTFIHAALDIAADNSGKLVTQVKDVARQYIRQENQSYLIVDGTPGIGCTVSASLTGADYVVMVAEPSCSGFHDMKRVHEVIKTFGIKAGCIINKADLNPDITQDIRAYLQDNGIDYLDEFVYESAFTQTLKQGKTVIEGDNPELAQQVQKTWEQILSNTEIP